MKNNIKSYFFQVLCCLPDPFGFMSSFDNHCPTHAVYSNISNSETQHESIVIAPSDNCAKSTHSDIDVVLDDSALQPSVISASLDKVVESGDANNNDADSIKTDIIDPDFCHFPMSKARRLFIEFSLALGGFAIVTNEFTMMGLLPEISEDFNVSESDVGNSISIYALGVVVGAPLLCFLGHKINRKMFCVYNMIAYSIGNFVTAVAPNHKSMLAIRFFSGLPHGAYFGVASLVAAELSPLSYRATAVTHVLFGATIAILGGNPLATWIGQATSWPIAFVFVGCVCVVCFILVWIFVPANPYEVRHSPIVELKAFNRMSVWSALAVSSIGYAGMFCAFSYVSKTLTLITGLDESMTPVVMALYGVGSVIGNISGGWMYNKVNMWSAFVLLFWGVIVFCIYPIACHAPWSLFIIVICVGTLVGLCPPLQTHLIIVANEAQTLAAASNHAAFNVANALGPFLGGLAIDGGWSHENTGYISAATSAFGIVLLWWCWWSYKRDPTLKNVDISKFKASGH